MWRVGSEVKGRTKNAPNISGLRNQVDAGVGTKTRGSGANGETALFRTHWASAVSETLK